MKSCNNCKSFEVCANRMHSSKFPVMYTLTQPKKDTYFMNELIRIMAEFCYVYEQNEESFDSKEDS